MVEVSLHVSASPERVFAVLADGWSYAGWVVGAAHIRSVDAGWPAVGTRVHHSVGAWPLQVQDETVVLEVDPPRVLELEAGLWPLGAARVRFELTEVDGGTRISMEEQAKGGPAVLVPEVAQALFLVPRNRETLRRLADLVLRKD
ncbi:SRPBCC family protein [Actinosynnema sp. NPDC020468]|uniref:SRPBCC family protein n=1 Tax=Actinosynnema sp. NPDC020468 TaxID=3154488 RepID=UPI0033EC535E